MEKSAGLGNFFLSSSGEQTILSALGVYSDHHEPGLMVPMSCLNKGHGMGYRKKTHRDIDTQNNGHEHKYKQIHMQAHIHECKHIVMDISAQRFTYRCTSAGLHNELEVSLGSIVRPYLEKESLEIPSTRAHRL